MALLKDAINSRGAWDYLMTEPTLVLIDELYLRRPRHHPSDPSYVLVTAGLFLIPGYSSFEGDATQLFQDWIRDAPRRSPRSGRTRSSPTERR